MFFEFYVIRTGLPHSGKVLENIWEVSRLHRDKIVKLLTR